MNEQENTQENEVNEFVKNMITFNGHDKYSISKILKSKNAFNHAVSLEYLRQLNFANMQFLDAYRKLSSSISITGESQDIDLINQRFAEVYYEQNNPEFTQDQIYYLISSSLLLNVDRHSKNNTVKMTCTQFIKNTNGGDFKFDSDLLMSIYYSIKNNKIEGIEMKNPQKRTSENTPSEVQNKKPRTEIILNFDYHFPKMKCSTKLFESFWKSYFCTINNLVLLLYSKDEYNQFILSKIEPKSIQNLNNFCKPVKELQIHHAYAVVCMSNYKKCELVLIDNSRYYFKFQQVAYAEHWAHCINLAASILSSLPFPSNQPTLTRTIINYHWTSKITQSDMNEQRSKIEVLKNQFELDLEYLRNLKSNRKLDKENLKTSEKNVSRFVLYYRTLNTVTESIYQSLLTNGSRNLCCHSNLQLDNTDPSTSSSIDRNILLSISSSSSRQHPTDISNIIPNTDVTESNI